MSIVEISIGVANLGSCAFWEIFEPFWYFFLCFFGGFLTLLIFFFLGGGEKGQRRGGEAGGKEERGLFCDNVMWTLVWADEVFCVEDWGILFRKGKKREGSSYGVDLFYNVNIVNIVFAKGGGAICFTFLIKRRTSFFRNRPKLNLQLSNIVRWQNDCKFQVLRFRKRDVLPEKSPTKKNKKKPLIANYDLLEGVFFSDVTLCNDEVL